MDDETNHDDETNQKRSLTHHRQRLLSLTETKPDPGQTHFRHGRHGELTYYCTAASLMLAIRVCGSYS